MKLGVAAAVIVCVLAVPAASASPAERPLSPAAATAAFGHLLHQLYGPVRGYWTCPARQSFQGNDDCMGEVEAGGRWHQYSARAHRYHGIVDFHLPSAVTWTRRWSPFSRHYILRSREDAPGVISVNSPAYDWGWLAVQLRRLQDGAHVTAGALDGDSAGLGRFYAFSCSRRGGLITCRNELGDAMRYRPRG
jgi:hypothetical protein